MMLALLREITPPLLKRWLSPSTGCRWTGNYSTWESAAKRAGGYDQTAIYERVETAVREVLAGRGSYERDGVVFHDRDIRWVVVSACLLALHQCGHLRVLDFGGSLGSLWLQHRRLIEPLGASWRIVEQQAFVVGGRACFPTGQPSFHVSPRDACSDGAPALAIFSAVLPYLSDPDAALRQVMDLRPHMILIDRTSVHNQEIDRITVQQVPPSIYRASYPCRVFARARIPAILAEKYDVVSEYPCADRADDPSISFVGWLFQKKPGN